MDNTNHGQAFSNNPCELDNTIDYMKVREYLSVHNSIEAENLLNKAALHTPLWYYLKGLAYLQKNWYEKARDHFRQAVDMEPNNSEFKDALEKMTSENLDFLNKSKHKREKGGSGLKQRCKDCCDGCGDCCSSCGDCGDCCRCCRHCDGCDCCGCDC